MSKGTEFLFGDDKPGYKQTSNNEYILLNTDPHHFEKEAQRAAPIVTTNELKSRELYGETA